MSPSGPTLIGIGVLLSTVAGLWLWGGNPMHFSEAVSESFKSIDSAKRDIIRRGILLAALLSVLWIEWGLLLILFKFTVPQVAHLMPLEEAMPPGPWPELLVRAETAFQTRPWLLWATSLCMWIPPALLITIPVLRRFADILLALWVLAVLYVISGMIAALTQIFVAQVSRSV
jgi:hypothetical protein